MDVTLRTLLNWMDGTLSAEEREHVAARLARSTSARKFEARIRAAVACEGGDALPGDARGTAADANRVAEYLDDRLSEQRFKRFEQMCLESDVHLGEVGACHGLLAERREGAAADASADDEVLSGLKSRGRGLLASAPHGRQSATPSAGAHASQPMAVTGRSMPTATGTPQPRGSHESPESSSSAASQALEELFGRVAHHHPEIPPASGPRPMPMHGSPATVKPTGHAPHPVRRESSGERSSWWSRPKRAEDRHRGSHDHHHHHHGADISSARGGSWSDALAQAGVLVALVAVGGFFVVRANAPDAPSGPPRAAVQGQVTLDGKPLETGAISLVPMGDTRGPTAGGQLSKGRFLIKASAGPVLGRYRVEITSRRSTGPKGKPQPPVLPRQQGGASEQIVPARYNVDSVLEIEIKPGRNQVTFDLTSPPQASSTSEKAARPLPHKARSSPRDAVAVPVPPGRRAG